MIPPLLHQLHGEVLVRGMVFGAGLRGLLIGKKAEEFLSPVNWMMVAVKADDFVSPLVMERQV